MERWHHFSDAAADRAPSERVDWRRYSPIELAENQLVDENPRIYLPLLRIETEISEGVFYPPTG